MPKSTKKVPPTFNLKIMALCVIGAAVLVGGFIYKSMLQKADINFIGGTGTTYPRPLPTTTPAPACATVATFSLSNNCGEGSYRSVVFTCAKSTRTFSMGDKFSCKPLSSWYSEAQTTCKSTCPSPVATATPQASGICGQEFGSCLSKSKVCIKYTDTCQKSANCLSPFVSCNGGTTTTPTPTPKVEYPSTPSATPTSYATSVPTYTSVPSASSTTSR